MDYLFSKKKPEIGNKGFIIGDRFVLLSKKMDLSQVINMNPVFYFSKFSGNLFKDVIGDNDLSFLEKRQREGDVYIPKRDFGLSYPCCLVGACTSNGGVLFNNNNKGILFWGDNLFLTEAKFSGESYQGFYSSNVIPSNPVLVIVNFNSRSSGQIYFNNVLQTNRYGDGGNFDTKPRNSLMIKDEQKVWQIIGFDRKLNEQERNILFERYQKLNLSL